METITDNPHLKISITQQGQPAQDIEQVKVSKGHWTLGARLCPLGTNNDEYDYRLKEDKKLCQCMLKAPLNRENTVLGFCSIA
jgi:hypothetical protein